MNKIIVCLIAIGLIFGCQGSNNEQKEANIKKMEENANSDKQEKIDLVMDKIRSRHGTDKISRATLIKKVSRNSGDE